jgi:hypothetical protein
MGSVADAVAGKGRGAENTGPRSMGYQIRMNARDYNAYWHVGCLIWKLRASFNRRSGYRFRHEPWSMDWDFHTLGKRISCPRSC